MRYIFSLITFVFLAFASFHKKNSTKDFVQENIDSTIRPGDDFFQFANGGWLKKYPIPPDQMYWGVSTIVQNQIAERVRTLVEKAANQNTARGTIQQKIGDFWRAGMDTNYINQQGFKPLKKQFNEISAIKLRSEIIEKVAKIQTNGYNNFLFAEWAAPADNGKMEFVIHEGGLKLPNAAYYLTDNPQFKKSQDALKHFISLTLRRLGQDSATAQKNTNEVYALEASIAKGFGDYDGRLMSASELQQLTPHINWPRYFKTYGFKQLDSIQVDDPSFFKNVDTLLQSTPVEVWKNYLLYWSVSSVAPLLDNKTFMDQFKVIMSFTGQTQPPPRWRMILTFENTILAEPITHLMVQEYFSPEQKKRYTKMVENFRDAFQQRLENVSWMQNSTKQKAIQKIRKMKFRIGYPDKWDDLTDVEIDRHSLYENMMRGGYHKTREWIAEVGKPVNKDEWKMRPTMMEASYANEQNELTLEPASFMIPNVNSNEVDDAFMYGYTYAGHEMAHGFDADGMQYDADGNKNNWWTKEDEGEYISRLSKLINHYNQYIAIDSLHVNGELTKRENMADLTGLLIGLDALKKTKQYQQYEIIGGFTAMQRYFLGFAFRQCYAVRRERMPTWLMSNLHSPDRIRVNAAVVNIPEFYDAFNVKPGDKMFVPKDSRVFIF